MNKIYKYTSIESAISILKNKSVMLNNPKNFNDPYDCVFIQDIKDKEKSFKLLQEYAIMKILIQLVDSNRIKFKGKNKIFFNSLRAEVNAMKGLINLNPYFEGIPGTSFFLREVYKKRPAVKALVEKEIKRFDLCVEKAIKTIRDDAIVSCFSKRNDSVLMWSHYANAHKGVCIEFEKPKDENFQEVIYQKNRPAIKIYKLLTYCLALDLIGNPVSQIVNIENFKDILKPFYVKSNDWSYEEEIRCVYSSRKLKDNIDIQDGRFVLKMDYPTAIYIGSKAENDELDHLIELCENRGIPVHFMKEDEETFSIVVDEEKKYVKKKIEKKKDITLLRIINDIDRCLDIGAYFAAFACSLIIPTICSQVEITDETEIKNKYIMWCNRYFSCSQKNVSENMPYLSGEICWNIKEQLFLKGNINVSGQFENFNLKNIVLGIEKRKNVDIYCDSTNNAVLHQNIVEFCLRMLFQAKRCYENNKTEIENLDQIPFEDLDEKIEEIKELSIYRERLMK